MSNSLDPDQAQRLVGPDLGPTVCQGYQQTSQVDNELRNNIAEHFNKAHNLSLIFPKFSTLLVVTYKWQENMMIAFSINCQDHSN